MTCAFYKGVPRPQDQAGGDEDTKELVNDDAPAPAPVSCTYVLLKMVSPFFTIGLCMENIAWDSVGDFDAWSSPGYDHFDGCGLV